MAPASTKKTARTVTTARDLPATRLLYGASEGDADILYAGGLFVPDPFPLILHEGRSIAVLSDLERDRAEASGTIDRILPLSNLRRRLGPAAGIGEVCARVLRDLDVGAVEVPQRFPLGLATELRRRRIKVSVGPDPFLPERLVKTEEEVRKIRDAQRAAEAGLAAAIEVLRASRIGRDGFLRHGGRRLTSEHVRAEINSAVIRRGCVPSHTIVAGGNQGCDPHEGGHGPLRAHWPIVMDIFPRSDRTGYWGDLTRTVVRGTASERIRRAHAMVRKGQRIAFSRIRDGVDGVEIHREIVNRFAAEGFPTERVGGRMRGFFHGTGHGVGLEIHEPPRIGPGSAILRAGNVVTVEPGLYEYGVGGLRLEDLVVVTADGCRNLTRAPLDLEI